MLREIKPVAVFGRLNDYIERGDLLPVPHPLSNRVVGFIRHHHAQHFQGEYQFLWHNYSSMSRSISWRRSATSTPRFCVDLPESKRMLWVRVCSARVRSGKYAPSTFSSIWTITRSRNASILCTKGSRCGRIAAIAFDCWRATDGA